MAKPAYLVYGVINRRFRPPEAVVAVLTASTDKNASDFFKAKVAQSHKVPVKRIQIRRILRKEHMTPHQLVQLWYEVTGY
jgi:ribosomal protein L20A (L18A)